MLVVRLHSVSRVPRLPSSHFVCILNVGQLVHFELIYFFLSGSPIRVFGGEVN